MDGEIDDPRARFREINDHFGQRVDGELAGITDVDRPGYIRAGRRHANRNLDQAVEIAERAGLETIANMVISSPCSACMIKFAITPPSCGCTRGP